LRKLIIFRFVKRSFPESEDQNDYSTMVKSYFFLNFSEALDSIEFLGSSRISTTKKGFFVQAPITKTF